MDKQHPLFGLCLSLAEVAGLRGHIAEWMHLDVVLQALLLWPSGEVSSCGAAHMKL